jgi:hypothetical protein
MQFVVAVGFATFAVALATCLVLLRQHGLLDGFCHMCPSIGLVKVDVDTYVKYQRHDENTWATARHAGHQHLAGYIGCKVRKLGRKDRAMCPR